jgi:hypothetical protein
MGGTRNRKEKVFCLKKMTATDCQILFRNTSIELKLEIIIIIKLIIKCFIYLHVEICRQRSITEPA